MVRTHNGLSLAKARVRAQKKAAWVNKVHRNCTKTINRIGNLVRLARGFDVPRNGNVLLLDYVGSDPVLDAARIQKVLGKLDTKGEVTVQMARISVLVRIKNAPAVAVPASKVA